MDQQVHFGTVAEVQAEAGNVAEALRTARSITKASTRASALGSIAVVVAKAGESARPAPSPAAGELSRATRLVAQQARGTGTSCEGWNTAAFFRQAGAADVIRCLADERPQRAGSTGAYAAAHHGDGQPRAVGRGGAREGWGGARRTRREGPHAPAPRRGARHDAGNRHRARARGRCARCARRQGPHAARDCRDVQRGAGRGERPERGRRRRRARRCAAHPQVPPATNWNTGAFFARVDGATVSRCLDDGANVHARDGTGATPLHTAAGHSQEAAVVSALLSAGARLGARDETGATPLHTASRDGHERRGHRSAARCGRRHGGEGRDGQDAGRLHRREPGARRHRRCPTPRRRVVRRLEYRTVLRVTPMRRPCPDASTTERMCVHAMRAA